MLTLTQRRAKSLYSNQPNGGVRIPYHAQEDLQMNITKLTTRDGSTFHCQGEDRLPLNHIRLIASIAEMELTPDLYDELRGNEDAAERALFFGEVAS